MTSNNLPDSTRVWIYQSSRPFNDDETLHLRANLQQFAQQWTSHNRQLRSHADVLYNRFLVLMVDETMAGASGCSIDKSVHFMQQIGHSFNTDLFDRMNFAWKDGDIVKTASSEEFAQLYQKGNINDQTLVFDNLVKTKGELEEKWLKPLNESWHKRFV
ncbi:MAG: hypothetical protein AAFZ15_20900 [Bacteroidota bacterium]